jgi:ATP-dependent DNA helicase UvrD/PcrA
VNRFRSGHWVDRLECTDWVGRVHSGMGIDSSVETNQLGSGFDLDGMGLNEDQRRAVVHDDGPMVVLAGPGTGKTRVITSRVAHMICNRGVTPEQIVAVTFTNKAAGELGERLGGLVGQTVATRVVASTFHSLGLSIVRRFGDVLGVPSDPILIDSSQRRQLIREIIREHGLYSYALGSGIESAIEIATKTMNELRNFGMRSGDASSWLSDRRSWAEGVEVREREAVLGELDRFEHAVKVYSCFEKACLDRGWMVFDDLILLPTRLINENPAIASILRHDHKHVVVDEFQDVNPAQISFVNALCPSSSNPDLCVVGDDDQSIYGFRGADDLAFAHFVQIYDGAPTVTLNKNYRSASVIVEASNAIIDRSQSRFDDTKEAVSSAGQVEGAGVEVVRLEDDAQSGEVIASMLLKMASEGSGSFSFDSCAVIARTGAELERIARVLTLEGIPVDFQRRSSPMDDEGVKDVLAWVRLIRDPDSVVDLKRILMRAPHRCDSVLVGALVSSWRVERSRWLAFEQDPTEPATQDPGSLIAWLMSRADEHTKARLERTHRLLVELGQIASESSAAVAVMEIVKRTGVVHQELGDGHQRARRISSLIALIRFAHGRAERFDSPGDLGAMLRYWEDLDPGEQSLGDLPEEKVEESGFTPDRFNGLQSTMNGFGQDAGHDIGAVSMLTAHSSKGLEFDTVFVARVSGPHGYPKTAGRDEQILPDGVIDRCDDERDDKARKIDEERRVFYVAFTRAERRVVLLAKVPKKASSVNFVYELRESLGHDFVERDASDVLDSASMGDAVARLGAEFKAADRIRDVFDKARQDTRRDAASVLDAIEIGELDRDELAERMRSCSDRMAIIQVVRSSGVVPDWAEGAGLGSFGQMLLDALAQREADQDQVIYPGLKGPLKLSFTQISSYLRCPRCYLVEQVLKLPSDEQVHAVVGKSMHEALEVFYGQWRDADAEGIETPGRDVLMNLVRRCFMKRWPRNEEVDHDKLEQVVAMGERFWDELHRDDVHIEELEKKHKLVYEHEGVEHTIMAVLDRVDFTPSGGRRVVDYKTGYPRKELAEPKKDDLQLGIYSMVLASLYGDPGPGSVCEYWLLQDATVGSIAMDAMDMDKIRKKIDRAISGILSGDWSQSKKCQSGQGQSACSILDEVDDERLLSILSQ